MILDELGSGTDPAEGMGIAVAILEELKKSGALFLVTTHYPEVKQYAERAEGMVNARMTFDKESLKPTYRLVIGEAGESCAFYIAGKLGMAGADAGMCGQGGLWSPGSAGGDPAAGGGKSDPEGKDGRDPEAEDRREGKCQEKAVPPGRQCDDTSGSEDGDRLRGGK